MEIFLLRQRYPNATDLVAMDKTPERPFVSDRAAEYKDASKAALEKWYATYHSEGDRHCDKANEVVNKYHKASTAAWEKHGLKIPNDAAH